MLPATLTVIVLLVSPATNRLCPKEGPHRQSPTQAAGIGTATRHRPAGAGRDAGVAAVGDRESERRTPRLTFHLVRARCRRSTGSPRLASSLRIVPLAVAVPMAVLAAGFDSVTVKPSSGSHDRVASDIDGDRLAGLFRRKTDCARRKPRRQSPTQAADRRRYPPPPSWRWSRCSCQPPAGDGESRRRGGAVGPLGLRGAQPTIDSVALSVLTM